MNELSQVAPKCEKHGCEKVWIRDKHKASGGMWRCRECNNEGSRRRNARNWANAKKREELKAYYRERWAKLPPEDKDARNQQIIAQRAVRLENDPKARRAKNDYQNARRAKRGPDFYREANLKRAYGITQSDYERILAGQGGGCAICGNTKPNGRSRKYLHVDHCHDTGAVRGILCATCNSGLGSFSDNIGKLEKAVLYLKRNDMGAAAA